MKSHPLTLDSLTTWQDLLTQLKSRKIANRAAHDAIAEQCGTREGSLTKPQGSLGRLEELTLWFHQARGAYNPKLVVEQLKGRVMVFAGNHGVAQHGVSAFPPQVTAAMVANFTTGGAAINQLAQWAGADITTHCPHNLTPTRDFTTEPAMDEKTFLQTLHIGFDLVEPNTDLLVLGEMGIGNSTAASALAHALYGGKVATWVGRGTGLNDEQLKHKQAMVAKSVKNYHKHFAKPTPFNALQYFGGYEMVAMAGAMVAGVLHNIPTILDSYPTTATLAVLYQQMPNNLLWHGIMASHTPAPPSTDRYHGHGLLLQKINKKPLIDLSLRLGEGTAGVIALNIVKAALHCHHGMATFQEASVAGKLPAP